MKSRMKIVECRPTLKIYVKYLESTHDYQYILLLQVLCLTHAQLPRRIQIPGAVAVGGGGAQYLGEPRPLPYRRVAAGPPPPQQFQGGAPRLRRPPPQPLAATVRPVVEDVQDDTGPLSRDEVARLHNIPLISGPPPQQVRVAPPQSLEDDEEENVPVRAQPQPIQFR